MAVSLKEVIDLRDAKTGLTELIIKEIDNLLLDGNFVRAGGIRCGVDGKDMVWSFSLKGEATVGDIQAIQNAYMNQGWHDCTIENSGGSAPKVIVRLYERFKK